MNTKERNQIAQLRRMLDQIDMRAEQIVMIAGSDPQRAKECAESARARCGEAFVLIRQMLEADDQDQHQRYLLRQRINRMVDKVVETYEDADEPAAVHIEWMKVGGAPQAELAVGGLRLKVDWLYSVYPDAFQRDTRDWEPARYPYPHNEYAEAPMLSRDAGDGGKKGG